MMKMLIMIIITIIIEQQLKITRTLTNMLSLFIKSWFPEFEMYFSVFLYSPELSQT